MMSFLREQKDTDVVICKRLHNSTTYEEREEIAEELWEECVMMVLQECWEMAN